MEQRFSPLQGNTGRTISGYAVKWGIPSNINGIGPEVFAKDSLVVDQAGCSLYFQHDKKRLLANSKSETLKLTKDDVGLRYECTLPQSAPDVIEACQRKDAQGVSVGFICEDEDRRFSQRKILRGRLVELSIVDKPAHKTSLKLRSQKHKQKKWTDLILEYKDV